MASPEPPGQGRDPEPAGHDGFPARAVENLDSQQKFPWEDGYTGQFDLKTFQDAWVREFGHGTDNGPEFQTAFMEAWRVNTSVGRRQLAVEAQQLNRRVEAWRQEVARAEPSLTPQPQSPAREQSPTREQRRAAVQEQRAAVQEQRDLTGRDSSDLGAGR